ncbi:hypothetical protein [Arthrobacter ruber]|nr:hypothetical protein [Arthrobacter ruber]
MSATDPADFPQPPGGTHCPHDRDPGHSGYGATNGPTKAGI